MRERMSLREFVSCPRFDDSVLLSRDSSCPRISIITPSFNQARYLPETLASVAAQTHAGIEHIVVDGGSTDGSVDLLRAAPNIRWISEPDRGAVDALSGKKT